VANRTRSGSRPASPFTDGSEPEPHEDRGLLQDAGTIADFRELVERGREPGARHDFCRIHEHTWSHFISQSDPVLVRVQTGADEGVAIVGLDSAAGQRLDETRPCFAFMRDEIKQSMEKWRRLQAAD
jgi:hypothetical protein